MRIVKLKGGLGNQMFQYAFAKLVEKKTGDEVKLDFSSYASFKDEIRIPNLKRFCLSLSEASDYDLKSACVFKHKGNPLSLSYKAKVFGEKTFNKNYAFEKGRAYIDFETIKDKKYYDGYWQSWKYVDEVSHEVGNEFTPRKPLSIKTNKLISKIQTENAIFIGVRRGDYLKNQNHYGSFSNEYYRNAMSFIASKVENPIFYVFSNDIEWCKANLDLNGFEVYYREKADQTDDFEELIAMSSFKHAIIVNSTYHWWAANLIQYPSKIICCPEKWFFDDAPIDIIRPNWVKVKQS